jgi:aryl-alcohol dehydrogenase-like predicted oxidoreductase
MKLGLGTVQFGLPYGITNAQGQVSAHEAQRILSYARNAGIDLLDTAAAYGTSEKILGSLLEHSATPFRIVSKTIPLGKASADSADIARISAGLSGSLTDLQQQKLDSVLVHHVEDILVPGGDRIYDLLQQRKEEGRIGKIGVSIYTGAQIDAVLSRYSIDLVQVPFNVFDQRLLHGGSLAKLKRHGVEIHARSIFLQGTLLVDSDSLPPVLAAMKPVLRRFDGFASTHGLSKLSMALAFIHQHPEIDYAIVGTQSVDQLRAICQENDRMADTASFGQFDFSEFALDDERMLNPAQWK